MKKVVIIGGGNGAHVLSAFIPALTDVELHMLSLLPSEANTLKNKLKKGYIEAITPEGNIKGSPKSITDDINITKDANILIIIVPAFVHKVALEKTMPLLPKNATVIVIPARSGFELQAKALSMKLNRKDITFCGFQTLPWACRIEKFGERVRVLGVKQEVDVSFIPKGKNSKILEFLSVITRTKIKVIDNFLALSLANIGQIVHPGIMYAKFKDNPDILFRENEIPTFYQSVDDNTARLLKALSDEILSIKNAIESKFPNIDLSSVVPLKEWLIRTYSKQIEDHTNLTSLFRTNKAYQGIKVPVKKRDREYFSVDFKHRYLTEDLPFGLVVTKGIAMLANVDVPTIDKVIKTTSIWCKKEFLKDNILNGVDIISSRAPQVFGISNLKELIRTAI